MDRATKPVAVIPGTIPGGGWVAVYAIGEGKDAFLTYDEIVAWQGDSDMSLEPLVTTLDGLVNKIDIYEDFVCLLNAHQLADAIARGLVQHPRWHLDAMRISLKTVRGQE